MTTALLPEYRADYAQGVLRLGLFRAWHRAAPGQSISGILNSETHCYRLTSLWDGRVSPAQSGFSPAESPWGPILEEIESLYRRHISDAAAFENECFELLWPLAESAVERDAARWPWIPEGYSTRRIPRERVSGCFAWEPGGRPGDISIHIANACMPESPFGDLKNRASELIEMIDQIRSIEPRAQRIGCNSWLNAFPPFLRLFPDHWPDFNSNTAVGTGGNWWGQFMSRDGRFHRKHGRIMRETLCFPYPAINGSASLKEASEHLAGMP